MTEQEYLELRKEIETSCRKKLEALDLVWQILSERSTQTSTAVPTHVSKISKPKRTKGLKHAIRSVINLIPGSFTINDIIDLVLKHYPEVKTPINPTSVSGALRKLHKGGIIELVEQGAGRRPSVYRLRRDEFTT